MIASARFTGLDHPAQDFASLVGIQLTPLDAIDQLGKLIRANREISQGQLLFLDRPEHVLLNPVARQLVLTRGLRDGVEIEGDVLPLLDKNIRIIRRQAVLRLKPLPSGRRQLADRSRECGRARPCQPPPEPGPAPENIDNRRAIPSLAAAW